MGGSAPRAVVHTLGGKAPTDGLAYEATDGWSVGRGMSMQEAVAAFLSDVHTQRGRTPYQSDGPWNLTLRVRVHRTYGRGFPERHPCLRVNISLGDGTDLEELTGRNL